MMSEGPRIGVVTIPGSLLTFPHRAVAFAVAVGDEPSPGLGARLMEVPCPGSSLNVLHWFAPSFLCPAPPLHLENSTSCPGQRLLLLLGSGIRRHTEPISAEPQLLRTRTRNNIYIYFKLGIMYFIWQISSIVALFFLINFFGV